MSRQFDDHWDNLSDEEKLRREYDEYRAGVDDDEIDTKKEEKDKNIRKLKKIVVTREYFFE